jgi:D-psicose/D-tagatose/L-ribulose 3-epimerase
MVSRREFLAGAAASAAFCTMNSFAKNASPKIKIGLCTKDLDGAVKAGFQYIEPGAADIAAMTEDQYKQFSDAVLASPVRCEALNSFIRRPELKVVGDNVPKQALQEYMEQCLARCRPLGATVVVWGSAGSRNVPEGFSRDRANEQIAEFLHMAGESGKKHKIVVAIEPLRHQESNILNTGGEALDMVRRVKHPNVAMIIDYYHMRVENEDPHILEKGRREIVHIHFANPDGRKWPHDMNEDPVYKTFFDLVKKTGYSGGISIEGRGTIAADAAASLAFFKQALA